MTLPASAPASASSPAPTRADPSPSKIDGFHHVALAVLAVSAFVYVTAEMLPVGLLPQIAGGLSVSEAQVGLLLSSYAAVAALSTIPLTALTMHVPRHRLIAGTVAVFAVSQLAAAFAPNLWMLAAARLLCALAHGVFWATVAPVAARLAPPEHAGRATSQVFIGNALALVMGVPLSTALGQAVGWRWAIGLVALAGGASLVAILLVVPRLPVLAEDAAQTVKQQLRGAGAAIRDRALRPISVITLVVVIGHFAAYTYIAPLVRRDGIHGQGLSALLLAYGAAGILGTLVVGRWVDRRPSAVMVGTVGLLTAALALIALTLGPAWTILAVLAWGAAYSPMPLSLQAAVLRVAPTTRDAASAVYVVAFQIGIGAGSLVGERLDSAGHLGWLPGLGAALALAATVIVVANPRTFPRRSSPPDQSATSLPATP